MHSRSSRPVALLAAGLLGTLLAGCSGDSGGSAASPSGGAASGPSSSGSASVNLAGHVLTASGGLHQQIVGSYTCSRSAAGNLLQLVQGVTALVVLESGGKIVKAQYATPMSSYQATEAGQVQGTMTRSGTSVTLTGVTIPSRKGGLPLVLNGTVRCE